MIKKHLLAVALLSASYVHAQESRAETQAVRCGAVFFVHTAIGKSDPAFGEMMSQYASFFAGVFGASLKVRTGLAATNGEITARRELILAELRKSWGTRPMIVVNEAAVCTTWLLTFVSKLSTVKDRESADELVRLVGEPPALPSAGEVEKWRALTPDAFLAWAGLDYATPASTRKMIQDSLKRP